MTPVPVQLNYDAGFCGEVHAQPVNCIPKTKYVSVLEVHMKTSRRKKKTSKRKWSAGVTSDSTHPPKGLFTRNASVVARTLASKRVSPKGPASGMRMLNYYINRAGKNLSAKRRAELRKAKTLLSKWIKHAKSKR